MSVTLASGIMFTLRVMMPGASMNHWEVTCRTRYRRRGARLGAPLDEIVRKRRYP